MSTNTLQKPESKPSEAPKKTENNINKDVKTPLCRIFTFWFSFFKQNRTKSTYENEIKPLGNFTTIEDFWSYYQHIVRPEKLPVGSEFFLFQENIKPMWEDENNQGGGRFILRLKKNYANRFWEDLILSFIGEQCPENDEICGLVLSVKMHDITISIWTKQINEKIKGALRSWIRSTLEINEKIELEFKYHPNLNGTQGGGNGMGSGGTGTSTGSGIGSGSGIGGGSNIKFHKTLERNEDYRKKYPSNTGGKDNQENSKTTSE